MDSKLAIQPRAVFDVHVLQVSALSAGVFLRTVSPARRAEARQRHLRILHPHRPKNTPISAGLCITCRFCLVVCLTVD